MALELELEEEAADEALFEIEPPPNDPAFELADAAELELELEEAEAEVLCCCCCC